MTAPHPSRPFAAVVAARLLRPWQGIRGPSACHSRRHYLRDGYTCFHSLVRSTRALQDCSDRVLAEPDMAAEQPVAQTSLCQLEYLLKGQARGGERLRDRADQELCVGCHLSAEGSRGTCRCVRIDGPSSSRRGRGSGSPPWEDNRLMRGSQLTAEFGVLLVQPVDHLLGIDRTLQQCGILGCELPLLLLQLLDQRTELGSFCIVVGPICQGRLGSGTVDLVDQRAMVGVDRVAADPGLARQRGDGQPIAPPPQRGMGGHAATSRSNAVRRRSSVLPRRFASGADGWLRFGSCTMLGPVLIKVGKDAVALLHACRRKGLTLRIEGRMEQQIGVAPAPRRPYRTVLFGHREVGAAGASALRAQHGIRGPVVAEAGRTLPSIDAITPVACTEPHVGLVQNEVDVFLHVAVTGAAAKATVCGDRAARFFRRAGKPSATPRAG